MKKSNLEIISKLKLKQYTVTSFKKYWKPRNEWGESRRQRVETRKIIVVYELWRKRLIARLFYLEEGYINKELYRSAREITRYVAGESKKIIIGVSSGFNGVQIYSMLSSWHNDWTESKYGSFIPRYKGYYNQQSYDWIEFNDYKPLLKESIHKYSAAEIIYDSKDDYPDKLFQYLYKYDKHNELEILVKMGLKHLLDETKYIRWSKSGLEMLGVTKEELPYLKSGMSLEFYRANKDFILDQKLDVLEAFKFWKIKEASYGTKYFEGLLNKKMLTYLVKNEIDLHNYNDYIRCAKELGYDLNRNSVLYPKDVDKAHDDAVEQFQLLQSKIRKDQFANVFNRFKKHVYKNDKYLITPVKSEEELIHESKVLDHCVRTYAKDVANGETEILFIREINKPTTPYITVEVKENKLIQVRGYRNNMRDRNGYCFEVPEDVKQFIKVWCKKNKIKQTYV